MGVKSRKPEIVEALIKGGADVQFVNAEGNSAVLEAAQDGMPESFEIIKILGRAKANMNASNIIYTPLIYAIEQGNKDLVQTLLEAGADSNAKSKSGSSPIHRALDNTEILQLIVSAKADPNTQNGQGDTPLQEAVRNSNLEAVKILLAAGANTQVTDSSGVTPLQMAEQYSKEEISSTTSTKEYPFHRTRNGKWTQGVSYRIERQRLHDSGCCSSTDGTSREAPGAGKCWYHE